MKKLLFLALASLPLISQAGEPESFRVIINDQGNRAVCIMEVIKIREMVDPRPESKVVLECDKPIWIREKGQWRKLADPGTGGGESGKNPK